MKLCFDSFISADQIFAKALRSLETCVLVNNNLCRKLVSSLEFTIVLDERFKVTSVPFFIPDFNLLICELDNFPFNRSKCYIKSFYIKAKLQYFHNFL